MGTHNRSENGRGAWVALCAHPTILILIVLHTSKSGLFVVSTVLVTGNIVRVRALKSVCNIHELSALSTFTILQSDINVKTSSLGNGGESEEKYDFCSKLSPLQRP
jgi:hypothetical protein